MLARVLSFEGLTGAEGFTSKVTHVAGKLVPHDVGLFMGLLECLYDLVIGFPQSN